MCIRDRIEQINDNQNLVVARHGARFKNREGYASDAINKRKTRAIKVKPSDSPYMPCNRSSPHRAPEYTGLAPANGMRDEAFIRALKYSPKTTGEPLLDNILHKMKKFYCDKPQ
eukprot:TRINITY_DN29211_c0_g1_i1.p1 TRINITY_DN29211_c0_g1~~TRINITY_DN29211_c0_g1_i1.p1  ORF type:complete len:114 (-),score=21.65 TRINITY_DN29211_c0_g1_i1:78-419(-)